MFYYQWFSFVLELIINRTVKILFIIYTMLQVQGQNYFGSGIGKQQAKQHAAEQVLSTLFPDVLERFYATKDKPMEQQPTKVESNGTSMDSPQKTPAPPTNVTVEGKDKITETPPVTPSSESSRLSECLSR